MSNSSNFSRRQFLKTTGLAAGVAALSGGVLGVATAGAGETGAHPAAHSVEKTGRVFRGRMFFTNDLDFATLGEAAERIFPKDETGPGARELQVPYFIDNQLAGAYGYNAREYMSGPFAPGAPTQGTQTPLLRRDLFLQGLAALNTQAGLSFSKNFPDLTDEQKDQILKKCEAGEIPTEGFTSAQFFAVLKAAVLAGVYADPIYGGNDAMSGWKMKGYPGARMANIDIIDNTDFDVVSPISLADMQ